MRHDVDRDRPLLSAISSRSPGAIDPRNSEYENQRYGLLSHQEEPLPRFPTLSHVQIRSKFGAVKAEVVWLEKPWLEVKLGERVQTADDSRDQQICRIARAVQDVELKGAVRLNKTRISRGSTIFTGCHPLGTAGNDLKTTLSESLGALDTLVPWQH